MTTSGQREPPSEGEPVLLSTEQRDVPRLRPNDDRLEGFNHQWRQDFARLCHDLALAFAGGHDVGSILEVVAGRPSLATNGSTASRLRHGPSTANQLRLNEPNHRLGGRNYRTSQPRLPTDGAIPGRARRSWLDRRRDALSLRRKFRISSDPHASLRPIFRDLARDPAFTTISTADQFEPETRLTLLSWITRSGGRCTGDSTWSEASAAAVAWLVPWGSDRARRLAFDGDRTWL